MVKKELWSWVKSLGIAIILALLIRENVLAFYVVDGNSMLPTLNNGQMVAVNKLSYNFKDPEHGDVIVFLTNDPRAGWTDSRVFIKRIIALPGDKIEIVDGKIWLNDEVLEEDYIDVQMEGHHGPMTLDPGWLFVMGDNRSPTGSWDSREFGPIRMESIIGRADLVIFPIPGRVR